MFIRVLLLTAFLAIATPVAAANVSIVIDLSDQHMHVSVDGASKYSFDVSTGRKGYTTPRGSYSVQRMYQEYYSRKYDDAPMPYAIFFRGGFAIHGTNDTGRLGRVASHGCVRLAPDNARRLYNLVLQHGSGNVSIRVKA